MGRTDQATDWDHDGASSRRPSARPSALLFTQSFAPETHAGANRASSMAEALSDEFDLTVVAPHPSHPDPGRFVDIDVDAHDADRPFRVIRTRAFKPHSSGYLRRGLREVGMAANLLARRLPRSDVVIATSPSFFLGPLGLALARVRRSSFVWDLRDLTWVYTTEGHAIGGERRHLRLAAARALTATAEATLRWSDLVVASNRGIADHVTPVRGGPTAVAPNGVDRRLHDGLGAVAASTPANERTTVTYAGALGYFQDLTSLIDAAAMLPDIDFRLVGDGSDRTRLERRAQGLDNVTFTGYVDRDELFDLYRRSDILFAQLRDLPVMARATFPSKVFEYLAAGRPIVYAGSGITAEFLMSTGAAAIANPEDPESIREWIDKLAGDAQLRSDMGKRGREASRDHIRQDIAASTTRTIRRTVTTRRTAPRS